MSDKPDLARLFDARAARVVATALLVLGALACAYAIRNTLLTLVFALFFGYLVLPLVRWGERRAGRVPRTVVVALAYGLVLGLIALAIGLFGAKVAAEAERLAQELPALLDPAALARRVALPAVFEPWRERLAGWLRGLLAVPAPAQALPAARMVGLRVLDVAGNLIYVVAVPIFSFLMVRAAPLWAAMLDRLRGGEQGAFWAGLAWDLNRLLAHYVRALALLSLAALVVYGVVLSVLDVPFALLLAGLAATLEAIPVFGPLTAAAGIVLVALFTGFAHLWWLVLFLVAYRIVQDYVLNPYLMSEGVDVPAILVVFGLLAGDELAGVAGIFLYVPAIAAARIVHARLTRRP